MRIIETQKGRNEKGRSSTIFDAQPLKEKPLTSETRNFQEARGSSTLDFFEKKHFLDETLSERKSRAGQTRCRSTRGPPLPPSRRENIFCFYCAPVPRERVPVKGGGRGRGGQEAEPTLKIPRRCLLSPRCLAFSLFATVRSGQKRPALSSSSPSPSDSPRGRDEGGWRRREDALKRKPVLSSRERERDRCLSTELARARIRLETGSGHQSLVKPLVD